MKQSRKWAVLVALLIISSNLVLSETTILYSSAAQGRRLLQTQSPSDEIVRIDPLDHFNKYSGNYDLTNKHYWSSTIFTGIYGYTIGLLWLIVGALYSIYLLSRASCSGNKNRKLKKRAPCNKKCYIWPVILCIVLASLAIIASGVALGGNIRFQSRAKKIMSVILNTADHASDTMYDATGAMRKISINLKEAGTFEADKAANFLASTSDKLGYEATGIRRQAQKNRHLVGKALTILNILTIITVSLNLAAIIALTVLGVLIYRQAVHMLVILCWILTVLCWLLFGGFYFLEQFSGDTCTALRNFKQSPGNSSLSAILPCNELLSAKTVMSDISAGIYEIVSEVNANISVLWSNPLPGLSYICNPFSGPPDYSYQPDNCPPDSIHIGEIPEVLKRFTCANSGGIKCEDEFVTTNEYNIIEAYTTSVQNLLDAYPRMENLVDCQFVKDAFSDILLNHCKPMRTYVKTVWIAMLFLSMVMMILVSVWANNTYHGQKHHFTNGSVKPSTTKANDRDPEVANTSDKDLEVD